MVGSLTLFVVAYNAQFGLYQTIPKIPRYKSIFRKTKFGARQAAEGIYQEFIEVLKGESRGPS